MCRLDGCAATGAALRAALADTAFTPQSGLRCLSGRVQRAVLMSIRASRHLRQRRHSHRQHAHRHCLRAPRQHLHHLHLRLQLPHHPRARRRRPYHHSRRRRRHHHGRLRHHHRHREWQPMVRKQPPHVMACAEHFSV